MFFLTGRGLATFEASHGVVVNTAPLNGLLSFKTLGSLAHTTVKAGITSPDRTRHQERPGTGHPRFWGCWDFNSQPFPGSM